MLHCIWPEAHKLEIIGACECIEDSGDITAGIEEVVARRAQGDLRPVVIYGFDRLETIKQYEGGSILDAPGMFYLKLPAPLSRVKSVLQQAANLEVPSRDVIDNESIRRYAIQRIRAFKHTCDNVWMSMEGNTNAARSSLSNSPGTKPSALKEFRQARIERLVEQYKELEPLAVRIGLADAELIPLIMREVIDMTARIQDKSVSPKDAVDLAAKCAVKIQDVADILSKAKELHGSE